MSAVKKNLSVNNTKNPYTLYTNVPQPQTPTHGKRNDMLMSENKLLSLEKNKDYQINFNGAIGINIQSQVSKCGSTTLSDKKVGFKHMSGGSPKKIYGRSLKYYKNINKYEDFIIEENFHSGNDLMTNSQVGNVNKQLDIIFREGYPNIAVGNNLDIEHTSSKPNNLNQLSSQNLMNNNNNIKQSDSQKQNNPKMVYSNNFFLASNLKDVSSSDMKNKQQHVLDTKNKGLLSASSERNDNNNKKKKEYINSTNEKILSNQSEQRFTKEDEINATLSIQKQNIHQYESIKKTSANFNTSKGHNPNFEKSHTMPLSEQKTPRIKEFHSPSGGSTAKKTYDTIPDQLIVSPSNPPIRKLIFDEEGLSIKKSKPHREVIFNEPIKLVNFEIYTYLLIQKNNRKKIVAKDLIFGVFSVALKIERVLPSITLKKVLRFSTIFHFHCKC